MYEYRCKVVKIIDGDTVDVDIDLGFGVWLHKERVRLYGIDTPESRTRDLEEKKYGLAAKDFLTGMLDDDQIILKTYKDKTGKFGRILGELWRTSNYTDKSINTYMIEKHHAVAYHGQSKEDIEKEHIKNREFVTLNE
jgi:micrococcal nuclease|tara:strand:+ start:462 stop:875 length:414 start_codon:yes stop_codon:yes gene_type:complete